jgi:hypothetical protein
MIRLPLRIEIDHDGVVLVRRRGRLALPWTEISRIGVSGGRRPWVVAWPASPIGNGLLRGAFPAHHGGYRVHRVAPWRAAARRSAEVRELRAALTWFAGRRFDPYL